MEDRLRYILVLVNEWLRFAEAKNAALVVATSGIALAVAKFSPSLDAKGSEFWLCTAGLGFVYSSGIASLFSFTPKIQFLWSLSNHQISNDDNFFFFGDIADYSASDYIRALYTGAGLQNQGSKLELDLAGQIIINSRIALQKFICARWSTSLLLIGTICIAASGSIHLLKN
jgi:hypothetical protein